MNFFKKFVSSYPEFDNLVTSLEDLQVGDYQAICGMESAFGKDFEAFYNKQPSTVSKALKPIGESMKQQTEMLQHSFIQLSLVPKDIQYLREQRKEFDKIKSKHIDLTEQYNKAKAAKIKANNTFENASQTDKNKAQLALHQASSKEQQLMQEFNASLENYEKSLHDYENNFIDSITSTLAAVASERQKIATEQRTIARDISNAIQTMTYYEDKQIPKLKQVLKDLDYEIVD